MTGEQQPRQEFDLRYPFRTQPDGGPCWCVSTDEPHEGWFHSPLCNEMFRRWWGGRRAPVQGDRGLHGPGTIPWTTHLLAWDGYAAAGHGSQSAERIAERGGFSYIEVQCAIAGHYNDASSTHDHPVPAGWRPGR